MEPVIKTPSEQRSTRTSRITMNVTPDMHQQLSRWASEEGRSLSNLCLQLVEASLAQRKRRG